jgi:hypothetical protein
MGRPTLIGLVALVALGPLHWSCIAEEGQERDAPRTDVGLADVGPSASPADASPADDGPADDGPAADSTAADVGPADASPRDASATPNATGPVDATVPDSGTEPEPSLADRLIEASCERWRTCGFSLDPPPPRLREP